MLKPESLVNAKDQFYKIAVCGKTASTVRRGGTGPLGPVSTLGAPLVTFASPASGGRHSVTIKNGHRESTTPGSPGC